MLIYYLTACSNKPLASEILGDRKSNIWSCLADRRYKQVPLMTVSKLIPSSCIIEQRQCWTNKYSLVAQQTRIKTGDLTHDEVMWHLPLKECGCGLWSAEFYSSLLILWAADLHPCWVPCCPFHWRKMRHNISSFWKPMESAVHISRMLT